MFLVLKISKNWHFLTPLPPASAYVIYEWSHRIHILFVFRRNDDWSFFWTLFFLFHCGSLMWLQPYTSSFHAKNFFRIPKKMPRSFGPLNLKVRKFLIWVDNYHDSVRILLNSGRQWNSADISSWLHLFNCGLPGQNGLWVKFYYFWPKNDGEKWSRMFLFWNSASPFRVTAAQCKKICPERLNWPGRL